MKRSRPSNEGRMPAGVKRPKALRACVACKRLKTRCELADEWQRGNPCHRCSVLSIRPCSFEEEEVPGPSVAPQIASSTLVDASRTPSSAPSPSPAGDYSALGARLAHVEAILASNNLTIVNTPLATATPPALAAPTPRPAEANVDLAAVLTRHHDRSVYQTWGAPPTFARVLTWAPAGTGGSQPVSCGAVTPQASWDGLEAFTEHLLPLIPHLPSTPTDLTSDAFLHTAALFAIYTSSHAPSRLPPASRNLLQNVLRDHLSRVLLNPVPSHSAVLALTTVALFASTSEEDTQSPRPADPLVLVKAATTMAGALGLGRSGRRVVSLKQDNITGEWLDAELEKARMYYSLQHLDTSLTLFHAPQSSTPTLPDPPAHVVFDTSAPPSSQHALTDRRLCLESRLLSTVLDVAEAIERMETSRFVGDCIDKARDAFERLGSFLDIWRPEIDQLSSELPDRTPHPTLDLLYFDSYLAQMLLSLRLTSSIRLLPFPLHPTVREPSYWYTGAMLVRAESAAVLAALALDLARVPNHTHTAITLVLGTLLHTRSYARHTGIQLPLKEGYMADVERLLVRLKDLGGWPAWCSRNICAQRGWWDDDAALNNPRTVPEPQQPSALAQHAEQNLDPFSFFDLTLFSGFGGDWTAWADGREADVASLWSSLVGGDTVGPSGAHANGGAM